MTALAPLERVLPALRCPGCDETELEMSGDRLVCRSCARELVLGNGCLDFVGGPGQQLSLGQRLFLTRRGARAYALVRETRLTFLLNRKTFKDEVAWLIDALELAGDEIVVDAPCGQGNFTEALARAVPRGIVIAIDLSDVMLDLARDRLERAGVHNVVLLRADALDLPLKDRAARAFSSCGGLHLYPDVPKAISEMRRVLLPDTRIAGLTFRAPTSGVGRAAERLGAALSGARAFDFDALGADFRRGGFEGWRWEGRALIGWFTARAG